MSVYAGPEISTNGLVFCLDAGNLKSYPGSGTTWTDLSGNGNNGTLTNGPTYNSSDGGSLVFDGTNDFISTTNSLTAPSLYTISVWFKTSSASGKKIIGFENSQTGTASSYDRHIYIGSDGKIYFGHYNTAVRVISSLNALNNSIWNNAVGLYDGTNLVLYINGIQNSSLTTAVGASYTGYWRLASNKLSGWSQGSDGYFTGNIAQASIYDRALSSSEIQQNFNALRGRFGI